MTKYIPHASVTSHPWMGINSIFASIVNDSTVEAIKRHVRDWNRIHAAHESFKSARAAVIWDLKTHYGVTDEELKPWP